jgi:cytochrome c2
VRLSRGVPLLLALGIAATAGAASAEGNAERGKRVFQRCYSCHSVDPAETNLQGPNLSAVIGRRAGTLPGFEFSAAMVAAGRNGLVWTEQTLDAFIRDPEAFVAGINMAPMRLPDPADRADLIAYLKRAAD